MKKPILSLNAPKPLGPYNQAVKADKFLFVSGQLPIDPKQGKILAKDIVWQTHQVMENIKAVLEAADFNLRDVVQSTVYLASMTLFDDFNREYAKYFNRDFPARTTAGAELKTGALLQVSVVAYKE